MKRRIKIRFTLLLLMVAAVLIGGCSVVLLNHDLVVEKWRLYAGAQHTVVGRVKIKVNSEPKAFHATAVLEYKQRGRWVTEDERTYGLANLPKVGHENWVFPSLRAFCSDGYWRVHIHFIGKSSTGKFEAKTLYFPHPDKGRRSGGQKIRCQGGPR